MNHNIQNGISCTTPATCYNLARFLKSALCLVAAAMLLTACGGGAGSNAASAQQEPEYTLPDGINFFEEGRAEERVLLIKKMLSKQMSPEEIIDICDCNMQEVQEIQSMMKTT